jgi:integrase/recombinase XerD
MVKIVELLDDYQLNQRIEGKKPHYIQLCTFRLNRWKDFIKDEFNVEDVEGV